MSGEKILLSLELLPQDKIAVNIILGGVGYDPVVSQVGTN